MHDIRALRNFLITADMGSVSRAAIAVNMAQSALSRQLRVLEADVGAQLFNRTGRGVELTSAGQKFSEDIRSLLRDLDNIILSARHEQTILSGEVRIGSLSNLSPSFYAELIVEGKKRFPLIEIIMLEGININQIAGWLLERNIDIGFVYNSQQYKHIHPEFYFREEAMLVGPKAGWPFGAEVSVKDLRSTPLIVSAAPSMTRRKLEAAARDAETVLTFSAETDSKQVARKLMEMGCGYAVFGASYVADEFGQSTFAAARISDPAIQFDLAVCTSYGTVLTKSAASVITMIKDMMMTKCDSGNWVGQIRAK